MKVRIFFRLPAPDQISDQPSNQSGDQSTSRIRNEFIEKTHLVELHLYYALAFSFLYLIFPKDCPKKVLIIWTVVVIIINWVFFESAVCYEAN
jgi:hypothetical protein